MLADPIAAQRVRARRGPRRSPTAAPRRAPCRLCAHGEVRCLVDLGELPVIPGEPPADDGSPATAPLRLAHCLDCRALQVVDALSPSTRASLNLATAHRVFAGRPDHARRFCEDAIDRWRLRGDGHVIEVGSGAGSLLRFFRAWQLPVLGIEPDPRLAGYGRSRRIPTWRATLDAAVAERIVRDGLRADLLFIGTPTATFGHLRDLFGAAKTVLRPGGVLTLEVPDLLAILNGTRLCGIGHTDLGIPTIRQLRHLAAAHHLDLVDVEPAALGTDRLRVWVRNRPAGTSVMAHPRLGIRLRAEANGGAEDRASLGAFARRIKILRGQIRRLLERGVWQERTVAVWGTSAHAATLAAAVQAGRRQIAFVADPEGASTTRLPGTDIPVVGAAAAADRHPDLVLALDDVPRARRTWPDTPVTAVADMLEALWQQAGDRAVHAVR